MKLPLTVAAMVTLLLARHGNASTDTSSLQVLDARISEAKKAEVAAGKARDVICYNAGFAMSQPESATSNADEQYKQCMDASQISSDAIGYVGYLYEQRSHLTGQPMPIGYACSGKPSLGAPHPDAKGHYVVCPKDPDDHSYKFWIITTVRTQVGSTKQTYSVGGAIAVRRYSSESECRAGIAKYEDYPSRVPYVVKPGVIVGDVCVEVLIPDVRELRE